MAFFNPWQFRIIRFGTGGAIMLSLKLFLAWAIQKTGLPLWLNYGIVHVVIVILSYLYHSSFTFKVSPSVSHFAHFFVSVVVLKVIDYSIVVVTNNIDPLKGYIADLNYVGPFVEEYLLYITIICSTIIMFFIRYFLFKNVVYAGSTKK